VDPAKAPVSTFHHRPQGAAAKKEFRPMAETIPPHKSKAKKSNIGTATCSVRLGELKAAVEDRAAHEGLRNISVLIRTAVRLYLADADKSDLVHLENMADEIREFRKDFSRIGGNLNQLALVFNTEDTVEESALQIVHRSLQKEFKTVSVTLKEILNVIEAFRR
jgi:hypothetical protein